jgi:hypothetical protein
MDVSEDDILHKAYNEGGAFAINTETTASFIQQKSPNMAMRDSMQSRLRIQGRR